MTASTDERLGSIFTQPAAFADPAGWHAAAKRIRDTTPILRVSEPDFPEFWAITKFADVTEIERNPEIFTNDPVPALSPTANQASETPVKTLIQMDGTEHKAHRNVVNDWFKPGSVRKLQERVDFLADFYIERMLQRGGRCDFVNDVALHFPLAVILTILGLPEADHARMLKLTQELFGAEDPDIGRVGEDQEMLNVLMDFVSYFLALANERREHPTEDLASVIANSTINGQPMADMDMLGHYVIIATAGHDTTSNAIGGGLLALLEHPDQLALLQAHPELIEGAADEIIRYVSPVKHFMRTCQQTYTMRGVTFQPGDLVYLSYASANRDEDFFPGADRLDVRRENAARHLAFGSGPHFCLGAHLARMEVRSLFRALLARVQDIKTVGEPTWIHAYFVQGPKAIPITYRARS